MEHRILIKVVKGRLIDVVADADNVEVIVVDYGGKGDVDIEGLSVRITRFVAEENVPAIAHCENVLEDRRLSMNKKGD